MATLANGRINGAVNGRHDAPSSNLRFSDIPPVIDIPVAGADIDEAVEVNLEDNLDDPTELCQLLETERASKNLWITIALAYAKQGLIDHAIDILKKGLTVLPKTPPKDRLGLLGCIAWLTLVKSRQAPRLRPQGDSNEFLKTKDDYLRDTTSALNDAVRLNPAFPPLYLTRGVLSLLRAGLQSTGKPLGHGDGERYESLRNGLKSFEDALKSSGGRNMMALMGKARALYLLGRISEALQCYQEVLSKMPSMTEPDPRIGIGCCFWQLGHPDRAAQAWERSLALNPKSRIARSLLGIFYLHESSKFQPSDPQFNTLYKKAVIEYTKKAYDSDKGYPLSSVTFASYFLLTGRLDNVDPLARKAIEQTDSSAVASDGWFLLARKEHNAGDLGKAKDYYFRSDAARGANDKGYWPAKFGWIQTTLQAGERETAKFRLEKLLHSGRHLEATTLLGGLYAQEVFDAAKNPALGDKSAEAKKAINLLETVRKAWKDDKTKTKPDESVLLYLSRLYEVENPIESMKCLTEVENMQLDKISEDDRPDPEQDEATYAAQLRENISPQLLNNMACFMYGSEAFTSAQETFQIALNACVRLNDKQEAEKREAEASDEEVPEPETKDTDALVTTISYNLGRTYEALGMTAEALKVYEGLLGRHSDYTDASARLAYMALRASPQDEGPKKVQTLYQAEYNDLETRALMGWYQSRSKRRTLNIAEDTEHRHHKHTLQNWDKHDKYALTGMGNIHLALARDMPRNVDAEKEKRSKMYQKAVEFFDKALQLDPRNAYAAQGIAIAMCDDKRNFSDAVQIFSKVKETLRDASVFANLGHVYAELRQFQRSIEHYELALRKDGLIKGDSTGNPHLLACLSRAWLLKGKHDKSIAALNSSLEYMQRALVAQPDSIHLQFNIAFLQFQIAQLVNSLPEPSRTLEDVQAASAGLEDAIVAFGEIARHKQPPYPRTALEQRAAMAKNTMRRQLERAEKAQREYEEKNAENLAKARKRREEDLRRREEAMARRRAEEEERSRKMLEDRKRLIEDTEKLAEKLRAEAMAREAEEWTEDSDGERVKRSTKKRGGRAGGEGRGPGGKRKRREKLDDDGFIDNDENMDEEGLFDDRDKGVDDDKSESRTPMEADSGLDDGVETRPTRREKPPVKKKRRLERPAVRNAKAAGTGGRSQKKYKSEAVIVDSSDEDGDEDMANAPTPVVNRPGDGGDEERDEEDEDESVRAAQPAARQRKQLRTIADDEDDEDEDGGGGVDGTGAHSDVDAGRGNVDLARAALAASGSGEMDEDEG